MKELKNSTFHYKKAFVRPLITSMMEVNAIRNLRNIYIYIEPSIDDTLVNFVENLYT